MIAAVWGVLLRWRWWVIALGDSPLLLLVLRVDPLRVLHGALHLRLGLLEKIHRARCSDLDLARLIAGDIVNDSDPREMLWYLNGSVSDLERAILSAADRPDWCLDC